MKVSAAQLGAAIDRVGGGANDIRLFLLFGPDEAGAMDYAARVGRALGKDAERIDLDGAALKAQPGRLADEAASISLFGGSRYIRVTGVGDESVEAIELLLAASAAGSPVVAIAPAAKASGRLVKLAVGAPGAMALGCYPLEGKAASMLASGIAREHGVRLTGETATAMFEAAGGDRAILTREIEKLALFLDAAPDRPREADERALAAIGANIDEAEMAAAIEAVIDGRPAELGPELARIDAAGMAIPLLRSLAKRLVALAEMRAEVDGGASPDSVVEKHRVFWKERASTARALRRWTGPQIAAGIARVRRAERGVMGGGGGGAAAASYETLGLARAAARR